VSGRMLGVAANALVRKDGPVCCEETIRCTRPGRYRHGSYFAV